MFNKRKIKLKKYIKRALKKGNSKEDIKGLLLKAGWKEEELGEAFNKLEKKKDIEITIPLKKTPEEPEEPKPTEEEKKPVGIKQKLNEISETLDVITQKDKAEKKLKKKNFKLPYRVKGKLKKLAVKNKVQVMLLQRTRNISPVIGEIKDGMLLVGKYVYNGSVDSTWLWRGKYPTHIVAEWDLQPLTPQGIDEMRQVNSTSPISPTELYNDTVKNHRAAEPQTIILRSIEAKQNKMLNKSTSVKAIVITIVVVIIIMAVLFGSGGLG